MNSKIHYWQQGNTEWWLVSQYYDDSGFTYPWLFLQSLRALNPKAYSAPGGWLANYSVGDPVFIPVRV